MQSHWTTDVTETGKLKFDGISLNFDFHYFDDIQKCIELHGVLHDINNLNP